MADRGRVKWIEALHGGNGFDGDGILCQCGGDQHQEREKRCPWFHEDLPPLDRWGDTIARRPPPAKGRRWFPAEDQSAVGAARESLAPGKIVSHFPHPS